MTPRAAQEAGAVVAAPPLSPTIAALEDPPRRALDRLHGMAFRHVQLSATQPGLRPRDLDASGRRDLAATLRRCELAASGLDAWIPPAHLLDPARVDRAVESLSAAIALARDLGGVPVSFATPPAATDAERGTLESVLASLAGRADRLGVALADHAVPPAETAGIGIGIDPPALLALGVAPEDAVLEAGGRLAAARLCDLIASGMRAPIGERDGRLDVLAYRAALGIAAPGGPVVVDCRQWPDPWEGLRLTAERW